MPTAGAMTRSGETADSQDVTRMIRAVAALLLLITFSGYADPLVVLAAASTTDAMNEVGTRFTQKSGHTVQFSFGSSGALARQIQSGAPADIFLSANSLWMDSLENNGKINPATRIDLLANRLVLIAPKDHRVTLSEKFTGRLATGNTESVPVGIYAKQMLEKYGWFEKLQPRLVSCDSARNVLFFVERGEVDAGIVYSTDANISDRVTVMMIFPEESHDPIRYPVAMCRSSAHPDAASRFLVFLQSPEASAVFERYGFEK
jgi:molybdate transport system substrate-binding protein